MTAARTGGMGVLVALGLTLAGTLAPALAQDRGAPVVVEMFTSQGCASCPPADAFFATLAAQPGVIALSLHVDYWDYLGWEDSFADAEHTRRQRDYARSARSKFIYTPQIVVGGAELLQGNHPDQILAAIARHATTTPRVALRLTREASGLRIEVESATPLARGALVQLVRYRPQETVMIERGENAGQQITYRNIVTDWTVVEEWSGESALRALTPLNGADPAVVIVQEPGPGAVLASAMLD